jgi:hypothetical protein
VNFSGAYEGVASVQSFFRLSGYSDDSSFVGKGKGI